MFAGAEPAKGLGALVDAERRHLLTVRIAPDDEARRRLALAVAPPIKGIEADERHEQRAALDLEQAQLSALKSDETAEAHALEWRNRDAIAPLAIRLGEELAEHLILVGAGIEQRAFHMHVAGRRASGIEDRDLELDRALLIVDDRCLGRE